MRARDILTLGDAEQSAALPWDPTPVFDAQFWRELDQIVNDPREGATNSSSQSVRVIPERHASPPKPKPIMAGWNTITARRKKPKTPSDNASERAQPRKAHAVKAIQPTKPTRSKPTIATKP